MSNLDLRRKCSYKPRSHANPRKSTAHGEARSHAAFTGLPDEERAAACEMDTVVGLRADRQCLLTLYPRPFKLQLTLLMPDKTAEAVRERLDSLQKAAPAAYGRLFGLLLTDNGSEFADCEGIERSALDPSARRRSVYYCDVRQSQQKGGCERNHVEVRKILPKGRGVSLDRLTARDCAVLMSHLNSEPRPALGGMCAIDMLLAALGYDISGSSTRWDREGPVRRAGHDDRGDRGRPPRARRGAADVVAGARKTEQARPSSPYG